MAPKRHERVVVDIPPAGSTTPVSRASLQAPTDAVSCSSTPEEGSGEHAPEHSLDAPSVCADAARGTAEIENRVVLLLTGVEAAAQITQRMGFGNLGAQGARSASVPHDHDRPQRCASWAVSHDASPQHPAVCLMMGIPALLLAPRLGWRRVGAQRARAPHVDSSSGAFGAFVASSGSSHVWLCMPGLWSSD